MEMIIGVMNKRKRERWGSLWNWWNEHTTWNDEGFQDEWWRFPTWSMLSQDKIHNLGENTH